MALADHQSGVLGIDRARVSKQSAGFICWFPVAYGLDAEGEKMGR